MDAIDKQIAQNQRLASQLLSIMNAKNGSTSWEAERARLKLEAEKRVKEQAELAAATSAVRAEQAAAHEKTQALPGIALPPTEPTHYQCPVTGQMVPFASSTEPISRGMLPPSQR